MLPTVRSARSPMLSVVPVILLTNSVSQSVLLRRRSRKSGQESGVPSFFRIHSLRDVFVNLVLQMKLELLAEVQLSSVLLKNRPQAKRQFVIPTHAFAPYGVSNTNSMAKESRFHCACSWSRYFAPSGVSE